MSARRLGWKHRAWGALAFAVALGCGVEPDLPSQRSPSQVDAWERGGSHAHRFPGYHRERMTPAAVCAGIDALDVERLRAEGLHSAAVFDLDNTVWSGQAVDPFLAALIEQGRIPESANPGLQSLLLALPDIDAEAVRANDALANAKLLHERSTEAGDLAPVNRRDQFYAVAALLEGLSPEEARAAANHAFLVGTAAYPPWKTKFHASEDGCGMREILAKLKERGMEIYIVSSSLDVLVNVAGEHLGIDADHRRGSALEIRDGRYTGNVESLYAQKAETVREWLDRPAFLGFGDSAESDFPFLHEVAGPVFMVNPDAAFRDRDIEDADGRFVILDFGETLHSLGRAED